MRFYRKYPCSYFFLEDFSLSICGETLKFPLPEILDVIKSQFGWQSGLAHFAWLVLNCPQLRNEVYSLKLTADGWWALVTLEETLWTAVEEGWDEASKFYTVLRKVKPVVTRPALLFDKCEEDYNKIRGKIRVEVDPLVSNFITGLSEGHSNPEPSDVARVRRVRPPGRVLVSR